MKVQRLHSECQNQHSRLTRSGYEDLPVDNRSITSNFANYPAKHAKVERGTQNEVERVMREVPIADMGVERLDRIPREEIDHNIIDLAGVQVGVVYAFWQMFNMKAEAVTVVQEAV